MINHQLEWHLALKLCIPNHLITNPCYSTGKRTISRKQFISLIQALGAPKLYIKVKQTSQFSELPQADPVSMLDELHQQDPSWIQCTG